LTDTLSTGYSPGDLAMRPLRFQAKNV
jgi:hypothetical protein